mmetsp:Transcript_23036/g.55122  ORF Transcript_23036/g.55122 Transcript_23036/m.55122 type:complete len:201 (+) Transcript_23036:2478-3080(+)
MRIEAASTGALEHRADSKHALVWEYDMEVVDASLSARKDPEIRSVPTRCIQREAGKVGPVPKLVPKCVPCHKLKHGLDAGLCRNVLASGPGAQRRNLSRPADRAHGHVEGRRRNVDRDLSKDARIDLGKVQAQLSVPVCHHWGVHAEVLVTETAAVGVVSIQGMPWPKKVHVHPLRLRDNQHVTGVILGLHIFNGVTHEA